MQRNIGFCPEDKLREKLNKKNEKSCERTRNEFGRLELRGGRKGNRGRDLSPGMLTLGSSGDRNGPEKKNNCD